MWCDVVWGVCGGGRGLSAVPGLMTIGMGVAFSLSHHPWRGIRPSVERVWGCSVRQIMGFEYKSEIYHAY